MKPDRSKILSKTNGRCGYCGIELKDKFHIDHIIPRVKSDSSNDESNLLASCFSCNNYKNTFSVEQFRHEISKLVERLNKNHTAYKIAKRYNLIKETEREVVFYFEEIMEIQGE